MSTSMSNLIMRFLQITGSIIWIIKKREDSICLSPKNRCHSQGELRANRRVFKVLHKFELGFGTIIMDDIFNRRRSKERCVQISYIWAKKRCFSEWFLVQLSGSKIASIDI